MRMNRFQSEQGFTMVATMIGITVIAAMALAVVTAVRGDINNTAYDLSSKRAYEAARAGIEDYAFHLYADNGYWTKCTSVAGPTTKNALNQKGANPLKTRTVPGDPNAKYAIELIPATGQTKCDPTTIATATASMLESGGTQRGTFRIRSTGFVGQSKVAIVASFKRKSFLDYVYFTEYETLDPVTYNEKEIATATSTCTKWVRDGRPTASESSPYCVRIQFAAGDKVNGPLHTNDQLLTCGSPTFGRNPSDVIEVSWAGTGSPPVGWTPNTSSKNCPSSAAPVFLGTPVTSAPILKPPPTNTQLKSVVQPEFKYEGQVRICLNGGNMTVGTTSCTGKYSGPMPTNGVVYVANSTSQACPPAPNGSSYDPFRATYPSTSPCGNVYVSGTYTSALTIAAENDIIINGNICKGTCSTAEGSGNGILGLIANNFVRIYHPFCKDNEKTCTTATGQEGSDQCYITVTNKNGNKEKQYGENGTGTLYNPRIDAANMSIMHSFIVDHYDCGDSLGTLTVNGAISQKFRGPVGTSGGTGYIKNYTYDDRFRYLEPPSFIEPVELPWEIGRETNE